VRVLIVEDERYLLKALSKSLRDEGYAVDGASDGEEGLYKATTWEYDAVILDVMLPKRNGWEILHEIRCTKDTPVLMLTARDMLQDRIRGLDSGADDYLVKPFDLEELLARLRAVIRRNKGRSRSVISIGDVQIDTTSRRVRKSGSNITLTAREYSLVECMALHRGQVLSRTTLYEHLCDEEENSLSKVLEVHVSRVRKKLGREFITTRRGHGYAIDV
jgi:two-component system OmpR family response regulator